MSNLLARRQFLQAAGIGIGGFGFSSSVFGQEPPKLFGVDDFGNVDAKLAQTFQGTLAGVFEGQNAFTLPEDLEWNGEPSMMPPAGTLWTHPMRDGGASATVQTVEQAKQAAQLALASGNYNEVHIYVPKMQQVQGQQPSKVVFDARVVDGHTYAKPDLVYRPGDKIAFNGSMLQPSREEQLAAAKFEREVEYWESVGVKNAGLDGGWLSDRYASFDNKLWIPGNDLDNDRPRGRQGEYMYVGFFGNRGGGLRSGGNCQTNCQPYAGNCQQQHQGSYAYGCQGDNCNLSIGSTVRGLLRFEFLRPARLRRNYPNLTLGQRLVARILPRVAQQNGWISCETAHLLLVKRLFVMIVAGGVAGAAAGGGAAGAGLIFIP